MNLQPFCCETKHCHFHQMSSKLVWFSLHCLCSACFSYFRLNQFSVLRVSKQHIPQTQGCQQLEVALFDIPFTAGQQESGGLEVTSAFRQHRVLKTQTTTTTLRFNSFQSGCATDCIIFSECFSAMVRESEAFFRRNVVSTVPRSMQLLKKAVLLVVNKENVKLYICGEQTRPVGSRCEQCR